MIPITPFVLGILGILDGISTYYCLKYQKMLLPKIVQYKGERGKTTRYFINKYGIKKGLICNYMLVILLAIFVSLILQLTTILDFFFIGFFIGMYLIVLLYNNIPTLQNYKYLLKIQQNEEKKKDVDKLIDLTQQEVELKDRIYSEK